MYQKHFLLNILLEICDKKYHFLAIYITENMTNNFLL